MIPDMSRPQAVQIAGFARRHQRRGEEPGANRMFSIVSAPGDLCSHAIRALDPKTGERMWEYKMKTKPPRRLR